jgi:hypothetical protein
MIVPNTISNLYQESASQVTHLGESVDQTLRLYCERQGFLFESRIKTLESVAEKIESGRCHAWHDIDDLYACTIVIPLASQEEGVLEFLRGQFDEVGVKSRKTGKRDPEAFRFDSTRFVGKLRAPSWGDATEQAACRIPFEIQVKTAFD